MMFKFYYKVIIFGLTIGGGSEIAGRAKEKSHEIEKENWSLCVVQ